MDDYLLSKSTLKPSSRKKYNLIISFLKDYALLKGLEYLDEFTPDDADNMYRALIAERKIREGGTDKISRAKPKTVNFYLTAIKEFFKVQILKDRMSKNPFVHIKNLKVERALPEYYTKQELKSFFAQKMHVSYRNAFKGFLLTGMRFQELANLVCSNVDLVNRLVYVRNNGDFTAKTDNSIRTIPMSDELYNLLNTLVAGKDPRDYVFTSVSGNKLRERTLLHECKRIAERAGIEGRAFIHKFRHTYATMLVQADVPLEVIRDLLGHSSIVETEIYAHNKTTHRHHQVQVLDDLLK